jgi:hypothetical protein
MDLLISKMGISAAALSQCGSRPIAAFTSKISGNKSLKIRCRIK